MLQSCVICTRYVMLSGRLRTCGLMAWIGMQVAWSEKDAEALIRHRFRLEDNTKMNLGGLSMEVWTGLS